MAQSMPRNRPAAQAARALAVTLLAAALLGAEDPGPPRPEGATHTEAVAVALELALLVPEEGGASTVGLDEARALLGAPAAVPEDLRRLALEAGGAWAGRQEPARRLYALWEAFQDPERRRTLLDRPDPEGSLARLAAGADFCDALLGSRHLPPAQAGALLAASQAEADPIRALELAGRALHRVPTRTSVALRQAAECLDRMAVAGLPGPLPWEPRVAARGEVVDEPLALLVRVTDEDVVLGTRALVSWRDGGLVLDPGPVAEPVDGWSHDAWVRWSAIARRRAAVALAGVTALGEPGVAPAATRPAPLLVVEPDLAVPRLAGVLARLRGEGVDRACLLARSPDDGDLRRACLDLLPAPSPDAGRAAIPFEPAPGATARDLARAVDEAAAAGRGLALAVGPADQSR